MYNRDVNRGYIGYSMSVRAQEAYEYGEMPYSKWTKSAIINYLDDNKVDVKEFEKFSKEALIRYFLVRSSWHHTSQCFNKTVFYAVDEDQLEKAQNSIELVVVELKEIEKEIKEEKANAKKEVKTEEPLEIVEVKYGEWEGTRRHPKLKEYTSLGVKKGNWVWISVDKKKSLTGKHVEIINRFKKAPSGTAKQINIIKKAIK